MFCILVQPVLRIMHVLHTAVVFILTTGCHVGRAIFLIIIRACHIVRDIFTVLAIIGEELYNFICELSKSLSAASNYVRTSANGGINCILEAAGLCLRHIMKFFSNTRLHSKLLATQLGCYVRDFFKLVRNALLLIGDCAWWSISFLPKKLITIGDLIIEILNDILLTIVYTVQVIVDDIFRLTIGVVLLYLLWHNRFRICLAARRWYLKIKRLIRLAYIRLIASGRQLFRRRRSQTVIAQTTDVLRHSALSPRRSYTPGVDEKPLDASQRCVICQNMQKCVLLLPCKHLCLCEDCADYLFLTIQRRICPLCRTYIDQSMSVYV